MSVQSALLARFDDDAAPVPAANAAVDQHRAESAAERELSELDPVVSAAVLVASAFRMRDEAALISTLRLLTSAVAAWETRRPEPANDD